jgi:hypothetical protein
VNIGAHVADDVLEKYLLHRLPEAELAPVEEHLLFCPKCQVQAEETEEYILITKAALKARESKPAGFALRAGVAGFAHWWVSVPVCAAVVAALAAAIYVPPVPPSHVSLKTMRGPEIAHARSGASVILDLDSTGLAAGGEFGVRVVDSRGAGVWTGVSQSLKNLPVGSLRPGRYWVRLTRGGVLLREYGLQID